MAIEHEGIPITFNERSAKFSAVRDGKTYSSPSVQGVKNAMDKDKNNAFKSFKALVWSPGWRSQGDFHEVMIVGTKKPRSNSRHGKDEGWIDNKSLEHRSVMEDTPANREAIKEFLRVQKERIDADEKMRILERKASAKIVTLTPPRA